MVGFRNDFTLKWDLYASYERCVRNFDKIHILSDPNGHLNFEILRIFEYFGTIHYIVYLINLSAEEGGSIIPLVPLFWDF